MPDLPIAELAEGSGVGTHQQPLERRWNASAKAWRCSVLARCQCRPSTRLETLAKSTRGTRISSATR
ncbi:MAG: hypothetical protein AB2807_11805 [Candidatus Sedimenticola endophacoides]